MAQATASLQGSLQVAVGCCLDQLRALISCSESGHPNTVSNQDLHPAPFPGRGSPSTVDLSEEQLLSCVNPNNSPYNGYGCDGGWVDNVRVLASLRASSPWVLSRALRDLPCNLGDDASQLHDWLNQWPLLYLDITQGVNYVYWASQTKEAYWPFSGAAQTCRSMPGPDTGNAVKLSSGAQQVSPARSEQALKNVSQAAMALPTPVCLHSALHAKTAVSCRPHL